MQNHGIPDFSGTYINKSKERPQCCRIDKLIQISVEQSEHHSGHGNGNALSTINGTVYQCLPENQFFKDRRPDTDKQDEPYRRKCKQGILQIGCIDSTLKRIDNRCKKKSDDIRNHCHGISHKKSNKNTSCLHFFLRNGLSLFH